MIFVLNATLLELKITTVTGKTIIYNKKKNKNKNSQLF